MCPTGQHNYTQRNQNTVIGLYILRRKYPKDKKNCPHTKSLTVLNNRIIGAWYHGIIIIIMRLLYVYFVINQMSNNIDIAEKKSFFLKGDTNIRFLRSGKNSVALTMNQRYQYELHTFCVTHTHFLALFNVRPRNRIILIGMNTLRNQIMNSKYHPPTKESGFLGEKSDVAYVEDEPRISHHIKKGNKVPKITRIVPKGLRSQPEDLLVKLSFNQDHNCNRMKHEQMY